MPIRSAISASASPARVETARQDPPVSSSSKTFAGTVVVPVPRSLARSCSGWRVMRIRRPPSVASRRTSVAVPGAA